MDPGIIILHVNLLQTLSLGGGAVVSKDKLDDTSTKALGLSGDSDGEQNSLNH